MEIHSKYGYTVKSIEVPRGTIINEYPIVIDDHLNEMIEVPTEFEITFHEVFWDILA